MSTFKNFEEIDSWQKVRRLTRGIHAISVLDSFSKNFGLRDWMCEAVVSVTSNVAEGFKRSGTTCFKQFLLIPKDSVDKMRNQLYVDLDQGCMGNEIFKMLLTFFARTGRMIGRLMNHLRETRIKGAKFKTGNLKPIIHYD